MLLLTTIFCLLNFLIIISTSKQGASFVEAKTTTDGVITGAQSCPCVRPPDSTTTTDCISYDTQHLAATLTDVISNFHDIRAKNPETAQKLSPWGSNSDDMPVLGGSEKEPQKKCTDETCQACEKTILDFFKKMANKVGDNAILSQVNNLFSQSGGDPRMTNYSCPQMQFLSSQLDLRIRHRKYYRKLTTTTTTTITITTSTPLTSRSALDQSNDTLATKQPTLPFGHGLPTEMLQKLLQDKTKQVLNSLQFPPPPPEKISPPKNIFMKPPPTPKQELELRQKRDTGNNSAAAAMDDVYQYIVSLDCKSRGQPLEENSKYCGLCDTCWQIGYLQPEFFPQYVNMMECATNTRCLSGYGECKPRYRSVTVLRNTRNSTTKENWQKYVLNVPISCECEIEQDSVLSSLVSY